MKRKLKLSLSIIMTVLITCWITACTMFKVTDKELSKKVGELSHSKIINFRPDSSHRIRAVLTDSLKNEAPVLVFVHGAPGDVEAMLDYHNSPKLKTKFKILSYDRPGYGYQDGYKSLKSIENQADILIKILQENQLKPCTLVAHSFGGPIALWAAEKRPDLIEKIILVAVAVDPDNEKYFWFGKLGKWKLTKWMLPKALETAGDEKYSHVEELLKLKPLLKNIKQEVLIIHGTKDIVVPFENLKFLEQQLDSAKTKSEILEGENHFIPFTKSEWLELKILE